MLGCNAGGFNGLCDICIDIIKFSLAQFYVHTAQYVDGISYRLPVKGGVIVNLYIQVLVQGLNRLLGASPGICLVNLIIGAVIIQVQVRIPEYADQLNLTVCLVYIGNDDDIRIVPFAQGIVTAVHAKKSHRPISLHVFNLVNCQVRVGLIFYLKIWIPLDPVGLLQDIPGAEYNQQREHFCYNQSHNGPDFPSAAISRRICCRGFPDRFPARTIRAVLIIPAECVLPAAAPPVFTQVGLRRIDAAWPGSGSSAFPGHPVIRISTAYGHPVIRHPAFSGHGVPSCSACPGCPFICRCTAAYHAAISCSRTSCRAVIGCSRTSCPPVIG